MSLPLSASSLIERLDVLKIKLEAGDEDATREALSLSRILTVILNGPLNTALEITVAASTLSSEIINYKSDSLFASRWFQCALRLQLT